MKNKIIYWIDLFAGAGGTSTGIHLSSENTKVLACVNHDKNAILSHQLNHPDAVHFTEDVRDFNVVVKLKQLVDDLRLSEPNCVINIWASLECTNFSNAKGGQPRDADSRSLAEHMYMYIENIKPDFFIVENVREFMSWGPLCENKKPISKDSGIYFTNWMNTIEAYGYKSEKRILNAADFGACQSRKRLFIQFSSKAYKINWPEQTHSKIPGENDLKKWNPVKNVLQLNIEGNSIFTRKKPLSPKTIKRILAGCNKFIATGEKGFTKQYNSGNDDQRVKSFDEPIGTVTTNNRFAVVQTHTHLNTYYNNSGLHSIELPSPTITTNDRVAKVDIAFIDQQYGNSNPASVENPIGSLTTVPKFNIIKAKHFILNPSWFGNNGSINEPSYTIVARQDKAPLYLISTENGKLIVPIYDEDCAATIELKKFMLQYHISDIKMRMLNIPELKQIQGFPIDYKLVGTQKEQKKYIGNAVEVHQAKALISANTFIILSNEDFTERESA
ncbi:DNA cytosine methyltransferase [Flavobacterium koreense]